MDPDGLPARLELEFGQEVRWSHSKDWMQFCRLPYSLQIVNKATSSWLVSEMLLR